MDGIAAVAAAFDTFDTVGVFPYTARHWPLRMNRE